MVFRRFPTTEKSVTAAIVFFIITGMVLGDNLTCYKCSTKDKNSLCANNATSSDVQVCNRNEMYCMVNRTEMAGVFASLNRSCTPVCRPVCGIWGIQVDELICTSCCTDNLCNTGSFANPLSTVNCDLLYVICFCHIAYLSFIRKYLH